jgi:hypothetical protein
MNAGNTDYFKARHCSSVQRRSPVCIGEEEEEAEGRWTWERRKS